MPFQKCKAALDSVEFTDRVSGEELGSGFADIVTQMAQDVSFVFLGYIRNLVCLLRRSVNGKTNIEDSVIHLNKAQL